MYKIEDVVEKIFDSVNQNKQMEYHWNIVVVGDNEAGKTTLLKLLLKKIKLEKKNEYYFIDSLNRVVSGFDSKNQETKIRYEDYSPTAILVDRSSDSFFSKEDIFTSGVKGSLATYSELLGNIGEYERLFNKFFSCKIDFVDTFGKESLISGSKTIQINGTDIDSLSSSQAAKIRLIMEIEYAKKCKCKLVIIDEFDDHFSEASVVNFINQLVKVYPELRFLFVIHDFDALVQLSELDVVLYNNRVGSPIDITMIDCDDITEIGQINRIRAKYISKRDEIESFLSECVSSYIKKGTLSQVQEDKLISIDRSSLNMRNKILFDYIMGHRNAITGENKF